MLGENILCNNTSFTDSITNKKIFSDADFNKSKNKKNKEEINMSDYYEENVEDFEIALETEYLY